MDRNTAEAITTIGLVLALIVVWDRFVTPWLVRVNDNARKQASTIVFDAGGFSISHCGQIAKATMRWSEVSHITAFKRDWFVIDCICLAISADPNATLEVDEEMAGWDAFVNALPDYLPGCKRWESWFSEVAFPAFATSLTEVYYRSQEINICRK